MTRSVGLKLVVLGALCYGAHYRFAPDDGSLIEVTAPVLEAVVRHQEELVGRPLDASEREAATKGYIEEEVLVREAFRRGLDRNDRRVRPMLIDLARRELLRGAGYVPQTPSPSELRAYFEERSDDYRVPERVDLQQVFFPPGTEPSSLEDVLAALRAGSVPGVPVVPIVKDVTRSDCAQAYGLDFATAVFAIEDDDWHRLLVSSAGSHLVRVSARTPSRRQSYEEVEPYLEQDFISEQERRIVDEELDRVRRRYRVEVEDGE